ncbi:MAG TPA: hypothetical protein VMM93_14720, partial [Vicinamibacterales bacterium]|nr:hypothetical protein [Vicinamibacterales bacterium]
AYGHVHGVAGRSPRWHVHVAGPGGHPAGQHASGPVPLVMGAVFAVSSLRMLMLLTPFGDNAAAIALPTLLLLITLFGVGILLSMSIFGVVLARILSLAAIERLGQTAAIVVALASITLGGIWIVM